MTSPALRDGSAVVGQRVAAFDAEDALFVGRTIGIVLLGNEEEPPPTTTRPMTSRREELHRQGH